MQRFFLQKKNFPLVPNVPDILSAWTHYLDHILSLFLLPFPATLGHYTMVQAPPIGLQSFSRTPPTHFVWLHAPRVGREIGQKLSSIVLSHRLPLSQQVQMLFTVE